MLIDRSARDLIIQHSRYDSKKKKRIKQMELLREKH